MASRRPLGRPDHTALLEWLSLHLSWIDDEALLDHDGEVREGRVGPDLLTGGHALLAITDVQVEPAYAGLDVGHLSALEAIRLLGPGCDLAVVVTMDAPGLPQQVESLDNSRLRRSWCEIGFHRVTDQVMVMHLATTTLDDNLTRLRNTYGIS